MPTAKKKTAAPAPKPTPPPKKKTTIDPEIAKLRKKHQEEVAEYMRGRTSESKLKRIIDTLIPTMTRRDIDRLHEHLETMSRPSDKPLPGMEEGGTLTEPATPPEGGGADPFLTDPE